MGGEKPTINPDLQFTERLMQDALKEAKSEEEFGKKIDEIVRSVKERYGDSNPKLIEDVEIAAERVKKLIHEEMVFTLQRTDVVKKQTAVKVRWIFLPGTAEPSVETREGSTRKSLAEIDRRMQYLPNLEDLNNLKAQELLTKIQLERKAIADDLSRNVPIVFLEQRIKALFALFPPDNKTEEAGILIATRNRNREERRNESERQRERTELARLSKALMDKVLDPRSNPTDLQAALDGLAGQLKKSYLLFNENTKWEYKDAVGEVPVQFVAFEDNGKVAITLFCYSSASGPHVEYVEGKPIDNNVSRRFIRDLRQANEANLDRGRGRTA